MRLTTIVMVFTFLGVKWTDFLFFSSPLLQKWRWKQKWSLVTLPISTTHTKLSSIDSTFTNWVNQIYLMDYYCATTAVVDQEEEEDTKKKCPFFMIISQLVIVEDFISSSSYLWTCQ